MTLQDKVAIVTGAGGGLGRSHALFLARHGARVVVMDLGEGADAVAREVEAAGGQAMAVRASVTDEAQVATMVKDVMARWGRIDILINNAGILRDKTFAKMDLADFRLVMDVHLMGSVICTKAVWDIMREQNHGRIVMTTSSSGLFGNFGQANYGAAKMALVGFMQTLSLEGAKHDIKVNCLAPTAATQMTEGLMPEQALAALKTEAVSEGLLALVRDDAPTRAILCAGAGHFERAYVTLTPGAFVGAGPQAAEGVIASWDSISDRSADTVPEAGRAQGQQELQAAFAAAALGQG